MGAGELREQVRIEEPLPVSSAFGADRTPRPAEPTNWAPFLRTRAALIPLTNREVDAASHEIGEARYRIRIRYRRGILETFRVVSELDGRVFKLLGPPVDPDGRRRYLHLTCLERPKWRQTAST